MRRYQIVIKFYTSRAVCQVPSFNEPFVKSLPGRLSFTFELRMNPFVESLMSPSGSGPGGGDIRRGFVESFTWKPDLLIDYAERATELGQYFQ
jgi:hypothetical protein